MQCKEIEEWKVSLHISVNKYDKNLPLRGNINGKCGLIAKQVRYARRVMNIDYSIVPCNRKQEREKEIVECGRNRDQQIKSWVTRLCDA